MATESGSIPGHTTPLRARCPSNATIAANLATSFAPPQQTTPNSGRKRRHLPNLSRSTASPSHSTQIANIFRDASVTLHGLRSPPTRPPSNSKRPRMPLSMARSTRFGHASSLAIADENEMEGILPIGVATPQYNIIRTPEAVTNPAFEQWRLPQSSSSNSKSGSLPTSQIPTPGTYPSNDGNIDSWLSGVLASSLEDDPGTMEEEGMDPIGMYDLSNKENTSPAKSSPSSVRPPLFHVNSSIRYPNMNHKSPTRPLQFQHPLTPRGHLSLPPRKKKPKIVDDSLGILPKPRLPVQDFTIHEDELSGALAELSPQVERYRKGRGPKRERRQSYLDEDVLDMKNKVPLGESAQSAQLTKSQPFLGEAAHAAFNFQG